MNLMQVNTSNSGDEPLVSNFVQFIGLVATVYAILYVVGGWKAAIKPPHLQTSSHTTAFSETSIIKHLPDSVQPSKDSMLFTLEALHTIPCNREGRMADANFLRIELTADESCVVGARSKVVEL